MSTKKTAQPFKQPIDLYTAMLDQTIRANRIVSPQMPTLPPPRLAGRFQAERAHDCEGIV